MTLQEIIGNPAPPGTKLTDDALQRRINSLQDICQFLLDESCPEDCNGVMLVTGANGLPEFAWVPPSRPLGTPSPSDLLNLRIQRFAQEICEQFSQSICGNVKAEDVRKFIIDKLHEACRLNS